MWDAKKAFSTVHVRHVFSEEITTLHAPVDWLIEIYWNMLHFFAAWTIGGNFNSFIRPGTLHHSPELEHIHYEFLKSLLKTHTKSTIETARDTSIRHQCRTIPWYRIPMSCCAPSLHISRPLSCLIDYGLPRTFFFVSHLPRYECDNKREVRARTRVHIFIDIVWGWFSDSAFPFKGGFWMFRHQRTTVNESFIVYDF